MSTSDRLRKERAALDAEIDRCEEAERDEYNSRLEELMAAVYEFGRQHGGWTDSGRKNITSVTVASTVTVDFGAAEPDRAGQLTVSDTGGLVCHFEGAPPATPALLGLIAGQLGIEPDDINDGTRAATRSSRYGTSRRSRPR